MDDLATVGWGSILYRRRELSGFATIVRMVAYGHVGHCGANSRS